MRRSAWPEVWLSAAPDLIPVSAARVSACFNAAMRESPPSDTAPIEASAGLHEPNLRRFPCPPLLRLAQELAAALSPGKSVRLLTPNRPTMLLELLRAQGLESQVLDLPGGDVCVHIHRPMRVDQAGH